MIEKREIRCGSVKRTCGNDVSEKAVCCSCGKVILSTVYTDRFYEALCRQCLLRLHEAL